MDSQTQTTSDERYPDARSIAARMIHEGRINNLADFHALEGGRNLPLLSDPEALPKSKVQLNRYLRETLKLDETSMLFHYLSEEYGRYLPLQANPKDF